MNSLEQRAQSLADNPAKFFHDDVTQMGSIPRGEMLELQLAALQYRFGHLRDRVPMLKKLADEQGIEEINEFNDVVPLLFEHTIYKAYPKAFLEKSRFSQISQWLNKLTAHDICGHDVSHCKSIDDWLDVMEKTPLRITHSSGTSGTMSFLPHEEDDFDAMGRTIAMTTLQRFGEPISDEPVNVIYPSFRTGANGMLRCNDVIVKYVAKGEENFHNAYPGRMSSDMLYLAARMRAASRKGTLDRLEISDEMMQRKKEFEKLEAEMPRYLQEFIERLFNQFKGQRVYHSGTWNVAYDLAKAGLDMAHENMFSPDSVIIAGGGSKGMDRPDNWKEVICRYAGIDSIFDAYGMSEVMGYHVRCSHNRYHTPPWIIPFILDPETSEVLPRKGVVTGRAAFYGLIGRNSWGGFITGDEITMDWESRCGCGQTTFHIDTKVQRFIDKTGDDDKINCAATPEAHREAMTFLSRFES